MVFIGDLFYQLEGLGVYEYLLPFILVFSLTFAILEKVQILGTENKNINIIVSLILGLIFVTQFSLVSTLNNFLPKISLFIIVGVMLLILFGIFGVKVHERITGLGLVIVAIISLVVLYWALSPGLGFELPYWIRDNWDVIIALVIILVVIALVTGAKPGAKTNLKNILDKVKIE